MSDSIAPHPPLTLGYIVRDEAEFLTLTLPKVAPYVDRIVAIDADSTDDTTAILRHYGAIVTHRPWNADYAAARNACIALAEQESPRAFLLMLDADEAMLAQDLISLRLALSDFPAATCAAFPRYEFVDDLFHFNPIFYPDTQYRCFPLNQGFTYRGNLHEQLCFAGRTQAIGKTPNVILLPYLPIFHYGKAKPPEKMWLKFTNYDRLAAGLELLTSVPPGTPLPASYSSGPRLIFHSERPI